MIIAQDYKKHLSSSKKQGSRRANPAETHWNAPRKQHHGIAYLKECAIVLKKVNFTKRCARMPLLGWKPEFTVHEAVLDNHHQELFCLLNTVYENVMNSLEVDCVLPVIDKLSEYTRYHFSAEEQYMREKKFLGIDAHIAKHREFTHTIKSLKTHYHDNDLDVTRELIIVLGEWLLHHVLKDDMMYSEKSRTCTE
jgi:hemerythrin